jgi:hypothetical protein
MAKDGTAGVVLGTRSAIFTPMPNLGLTSVWNARSLTVLEFILRFLRMNDMDLFALDDVCSILGPTGPYIH